jgi:hypothetical protein
MQKGVVALVVLSVFSCTKGDGGKDDSASSSSEESQNKIGEINVGENSLEGLKLSESISPAVPASVTATGDGVDPKAGDLSVATLTAEDRKKSLEACQIRQKIREAKMNQEVMSMQLCYIQAQKGMKAGGKYKMSFAAGGPALRLTQSLPPAPDGNQVPPAGADAPTGSAPDVGQMPDGGAGPDAGAGAPQDMDMAIFLDNSEAGKFKIYMCQDNKLSQKIVVEGAGETGAKGSFKAVMDMEGVSASIQGSFDSGVELPGHNRSSSQVAFDMDMGGSTMHMRSNIGMDLVEDGVSVVMAANEASSTMGDFDSSFKELGTALIGPNLGAALFQRSVDASHPVETFQMPSAEVPSDTNDVPEIPDLPPPLRLTGDKTYVTSRSFFDSAGYELKQSDSDSFADGGLLNVKDTDLPKLLADDFKVEFEASDWDCSGAEEFTMVTDSSSFQACADKFASSFEMETCEAGAVYGAGIEATDVDPVLDQRVEGGELPPELPPTIEDVPPPVE